MPECATEPLRCQYLVPRKKRNCRMIVKPGQRFCGEHAPVTKEVGTAESSSGRIPCPLDPKHTVEAPRLASHLKKCPAKRMRDSVNTRYVCTGYNLGRLNVQMEPSSIISLTLKTTSDDHLLGLISRLEDVTSSFSPLRVVSPSPHRVLKEEFDDERNGPAVLKHLEQNSTLIAIIEDAGLLESSAVIVEFGSGRGRLTYWLTRVDGEGEHDFLLVDKASHRHKFDNKLKDEVESVSVERIRVDIQDVVLKRIPQIENSSKGVVGVSKHLCGGATDLALLSLEDVGDRLQGFVIALCCHHRCSWSTFCARDYLVENGFQPEEFSLLCAITSWATCGTGRPRDATEAATSQEGFKSRYDSINLPLERRQQLGISAKRLLNEARLSYVQQTFPNVNVELVIYCDRTISIENVAIVASRQ